MDQGDVDFGAARRFMRRRKPYFLIAYFDQLPMLTLARFNSQIGSLSNEAVLLYFFVLRQERVGLDVGCCQSISSATTQQRVG